MKFNLWLKTSILLLGLVSISTFEAAADGWNPLSQAPNDNGIVSTRHNMTQSWMGFGSIMMITGRNDYAAVCVYCHTPHGANTQVQAPLWNHTISTAQYTIYSSPSLSSTTTDPGTSSITCLSCHDGTVAIDSIINMPGPGGYLKLNETGAGDEAFLDSWIGLAADKHRVLGSETEDKVGCALCHNQANGDAETIMNNFGDFVVGPDLSNDHPIGILFPQAMGVSGFKVPTGEKLGEVLFYDINGSNTPNANEIRFYDSGQGYEVECASCHDPHGVSEGGGAIIPSFLRVNNAGSALCFTCHIK